jgi:hypothetical protein
MKKRRLGFVNPLAFTALLGMIFLTKKGSTTPTPPPEDGQPGYQIPIELHLSCFPMNTGSVMPTPQPPYFDGQDVELKYIYMGANEVDYWGINEGFPGGFRAYGTIYNHHFDAYKSYKQGDKYYDFVVCHTKSLSPTYYVNTGGILTWQRKV